MTCPRCSGLMAVEYIPRTFKGIRELWKCVNCGERLDETIVKNRRLNPPKD